MIVFSWRVTSFVWKSKQPLSICFTLKHGTFSTKKSSRFLLHFFIATNIANKPLSDCITSPKAILPFHFSPKPTAERETKPNNFSSIKLTRDCSKEHMPHSYYSDANQSFLPTPLNSSPGANYQICLLFTERYRSQKSESVYIASTGK